MINQMMFEMDEVAQRGAALLEQAAALAHSLDEWAGDQSECGNVRVQACRGAVVLVATIRWP